MLNVKRCECVDALKITVNYRYALLCIKCLSPTERRDYNLFLDYSFKCKNK